MLSLMEECSKCFGHISIAAMAYASFRVRACQGVNPGTPIASCESTPISPSRTFSRHCTVHCPVCVHGFSIEAPGLFRGGVHGHRGAQDGGGKI